MEIKIAAVGGRTETLGFKAAGFAVFPAEEGVSLEKLIFDLAKQDYGIIFVTEELLAADPAGTEPYKAAVLPAVIPIPGRSGSRGIGMENIRRNVEKAVGADIFNQ